MEYTAEVIKITELFPHPNADLLSIIRINDFQVVVRTNDWRCGDLGIYVEPDTVCPDRPEFEFLGRYHRIKARKLRGEWSIGLLIPAPEDAKIGEDYFLKLGLEHYEPKSHDHFNTGGENVGAPKGFYPVYDIANFRKYAHLFQDGEEVIVTEKLHGCNSRFTYVDDKIYCGSRKFWKKEDPNNLWCKALSTQDALQAWLRHHPGYCVFGEIFGQVQNLKYGAKPGEIFFAAFDILKGDKWLDYDEAHQVGAPLSWVPLIYRGPFNKEKMFTFAEGDTLYPFAENIREGAVVKPVHERTNQKIGRVQLKIVSNRYLSKN